MTLSATRPGPPGRYVGHHHSFILLLNQSDGGIYMSLRRLSGIKEQGGGGTHRVDGVGLDSSVAVRNQMTYPAAVANRSQ